jgi:hypothetical protein
MKANARYQQMLKPIVDVDVALVGCCKSRVNAPVVVVVAVSHADHRVAPTARD